jgi:hypothetical protein
VAAATCLKTVPEAVPFAHQHGVLVKDRDDPFLWN